jgi:drug/metabolite transporter (DMT)-like permease
MQMLAYINPETAVMFRTFSLVGVSFGDFIFFRKYFELNESISVLCVLVGGVLYAVSDIQFSLQGYKWGVLYVLSLTANLLILKAAFNSSKGVGDWEKTFYLNANGSLLLLAFVVLFEIDAEPQNPLTTNDFVGSSLLLSSCLLGLAIGYFASVTRDALSATAFDVLSNTSKFFTIALSVALFDSRLSYLSSIGLLISVSGGALFSKKIWALLVEHKFCSRSCALTLVLGSIICAPILVISKNIA